jgi:cellulose synthase operon protein B
MKRLRTLLLACCVLLAGFPVISAARADNAALSFDQLNLRDLRMRGPSDAAFFSFATPAHWTLSAPANLALDFDVVIPGDASNGLAISASQPITSTGAAGTRNCVAGTLNVSMNDQFLGSFPLLRAGAQSLSVPIPANALTPRADGRHSVFMAFDAPDRCGVDQYPQVLFRGSSQIVINKTDGEVRGALANLPRPLFQQALEPDRAVIVVPDQPSANEIEAAMNVAAGFGQMTGGAMTVTLSAISAMSDEMWRDNHLILIGRPGNLPVIGVTQLPSAVEGARFEAGSADDGVIQLAVSPYNRTKAALIISGNSDAGVAKAGRAASRGGLRPAGRANLAVVADVGASAPITGVVASERSFTALGYNNLRAVGAGTNNFSYEFDAPDNANVSGEAYVELSYVHSALLDYDRSAVNVFVNDTSVGSIRLADSSTRASRTRVLIPAAAVRPGRNRMIVQTVMSPRSLTRNLAFDALWLAIQADSNLVIPFTGRDIPPAPVRPSLGIFPQPFLTQSDLSETAFVVPARNAAAWATAADIAFALGAQSVAGPMSARAMFADALDSNVRDARNLIVVGKASELAVMGELNTFLPAPFEGNSNVAVERNAGVAFRVGEGEPIGYLQTIQSPFNPTRNILLALGSTDSGLRWAGQALRIGERRSKLSGNLAVINEADISASEVRVTSPLAAAVTTEDATATPASGFAQPNATPVVSQAGAPTNQEGSRGLLLVLFGLAGIAIVLIIGAAVYNQWRRRRGY